MSQDSPFKSYLRFSAVAALLFAVVGAIVSASQARGTYAALFGLVALVAAVALLAVRRTR